MDARRVESMRIQTLWILAGLLPEIAASALAGSIFRVPDDFPTIQGAIDGCTSGDMIVVGAGVYLENVDFKGKEIVLRSEEAPAADSTSATGPTPTSPATSSPATIRAESPGSCPRGIEGPSCIETPS
jgi:hypothetical protein